MGLALPKRVLSTAWSEQQKIAGIDILEIPIHKVLFAGLDNYGLRILGSGSQLYFVSFRHYLASSVLQKVAQELQGFDWDSCLTTFAHSHNKECKSLEHKKAISHDLAAELVAHIRGASINKTEELLRQKLAESEAKLAKFDLMTKSQTTLSFPSAPKKKDEVPVEPKAEILTEGLLESIARPPAATKILSSKAPITTTPRMVTKWVANLPISDAKKKSIDILSKKLWAEFQAFEDIDLSLIHI